MNPAPSRTRIAVVMVVLAIGAFGISYWHYQDMVTPIPEFKSLKQIPAAGMRYGIARPRGVSSQVSFEFTDQRGNRFQTDYMEAEEAEAIKDALERGGVILSVGRWKHAFESNSIFTVYHMTRGDKVLIDYKRIAESKRLEQQGAVPVMVISLTLAVGIVVFVFWKKYNRAMVLSLFLSCGTSAAAESAEKPLLPRERVAQVEGMYNGFPKTDDEDSVDSFADRHKETFFRGTIRTSDGTFGQ